MKRIVISYIIILFSCGIVVAQKATVMFHIGTATYRMKDQKELQNDVRGEVIPWKPVHKFPPYWLYAGSFSFNFSQRFGASLYFEYGSTGGKLDYIDYSGSAQFKQLLRYTQFGIGEFAQINCSQNWPIFITAHILISRTREELSYSIVVGSSKEQDAETYKGINLGIRPGLMMQRRLNAFLFQANLGYEFQFPGKLKNSGDQPLLLQNGDKVYAQWSGLRGTLGVGLIINKRID